MSKSEFIETWYLKLASSAAVVVTSIHRSQLFEKNIYLCIFLKRFDELGFNVTLEIKKKFFKNSFLQCLYNHPGWNKINLI